MNDGATGRFIGIQSAVATHQLLVRLGEVSMIIRTLCDSKLIAQIVVICTCTASRGAGEPFDVVHANNCVNKR